MCVYIYIYICVHKSFGTRSNAMSTHQDGLHAGFIPELHTRTYQRISKDRERRILFMEDLTRPSYKNFL